MDRVKRLLNTDASYEPLQDDSGHDDDTDASNQPAVADTKRRFSYIAYFVFIWVGIAMLWAWNMFLAAAPYLQHRFGSSKFILNNFQATELAVSTVANLGSMLVLSNLQKNANYPRRIVVSLIIYTATFILLAISTKAFLQISASVYFGFIVFTIFTSSLATGFLQNGAFAYAAGFNDPVYVQGIMLGQAIAGILPPLVQIISVIGPSSSSESESRTSSSALAYFLTAAGVSLFTLAAFWLLYTNYTPRPTTSAIAENDYDHADSSLDPDAAMTSSTASLARKKVSLWTLFRKLFFSAAAVFLTFGVTMVFPVFTQEILSVTPDASPILRNAAFIPLGLLVWNIGDLLGRLIPAVPRLSLDSRPRILLLLSITRVIFIPLYLLCNIQPAKSSPSAHALGVIMPDTFYLLVVQFPFGLTNGYLGTCCMSGAGQFVDEDEREAAGGFMGLMLVLGLAVGSFCSFFIGNST